MEEYEISEKNYEIETFLPPAFPILQQDYVVTSLINVDNAISFCECQYIFSTYQLSLHCPTPLHTPTQYLPIIVSD